MALAALLAVADTAETVKPLTAGKIGIYLAIVIVVCAAIVLAGLGYFTPGND